MVLACTAAACGLLGCGGNDEDLVIQRGNTTVVIPAAARTQAPIDLRKGQAIAEKISKGRVNPEKLTTEERRQLGAFLEAVAPNSMK